MVLAHLGLVGYGSIGQALGDLIAQERGDMRLSVLVRAGREAATRAALDGQGLSHAQVYNCTQAFLAQKPDLVVEAAGHGAVAETIVAALSQGIDAIVISVGALADQALYDAALTAAQQGKAQMILPAGAIGGIDIVAALTRAGGAQLTYRGSKPPLAWRGTQAETLLDLSALAVATPFFTGTAREAALAYPKNANVAATLALAGAGFDATRVELVADPEASGNIHAFTLESDLATVRMRIDNRPSQGNAKTSATTIHAIWRCIRNRDGAVVI